MKYEYQTASLNSVEWRDEENPVRGLDRMLENYMNRGFRLVFIAQVPISGDSSGRGDSKCRSIYIWEREKPE